MIKYINNLFNTSNMSIALIAVITITALAVLIMLFGKNINEAFSNLPYYKCNDYSLNANLDRLPQSSYMSFSPSKYQAKIIDENILTENLYGDQFKSINAGTIQPLLYPAYPQNKPEHTYFGNGVPLYTEDRITFPYDSNEMNKPKQIWQSTKTTDCKSTMYSTTGACVCDDLFTKN